VLESVVDTDAHTVTAYTPHFSRYLLGFQEKDVTAAPEVTETATSTVQSSGSRPGTRIKRPVPQVLGASLVIKERQVEQLSALVEEVTLVLNRQVNLTEVQKELLAEILKESLRLLEFFK